MDNITRRSPSSSPDFKAEVPSTTSEDKEDRSLPASTSDMSTTITVYYVASDNAYYSTDGSGLSLDVQLYYWDEQRRYYYAYPENQIPGYTRASDGRFYPEASVAGSSSSYAQPSSNTSSWGTSGTTLSASSNAAQLFQMASSNPNLGSTGGGSVLNMNYPRGRISSSRAFRLSPRYIAFAKHRGSDPIHAKFAKAVARLQGGV